MGWFNPYGLAVIILIMIPNVVFAVKNKDGFINVWSNKTIEILEQVGRFGCFGTMIINIPGTVKGFSSEELFTAYLIVNSVLTLVYCLIWIIFFRRSCLFRALALSILPSVIFLFCGIVSRSVLLTTAALIFAPTHILISYKNVSGKSNPS